jgi:hypothetical protein
MTTGKIAIALALFAVTGCARTDQLACGPALPPIAAAPSPVAPTPGAAPVTTAAAPAAAPALTPAQIRAMNPLENRAAVAGR